MQCFGVWKVFRLMNVLRNQDFIDCTFVFALVPVHNTPIVIASNAVLSPTIMFSSSPVLQLCPLCHLKVKTTTTSPTYHITMSYSHSLPVHRFTWMPVVWIRKHFTPEMLYDSYLFSCSTHIDHFQDLQLPPHCLNAWEGISSELRYCNAADTNLYKTVRQGVYVLLHLVSDYCLSRLVATLAKTSLSLVHIKTYFDHVYCS